MKEIYVDNFEYKRATSPDTLSSGGTGPCIVVGAIYDDNGYMVHFSDKDECFDKMINDLKSNAVQKDELKIYISGGGLSTPFSDIDIGINQNTLNLRNYVLEKINEAGLSGNIKTKKWGKPNDIQSMQLVLKDGMAKYSEISDMDIDDTEEWFD